MWERFQPDKAKGKAPFNRKNLNAFITKFSQVHLNEPNSCGIIKQRCGVHSAVKTGVVIVVFSLVLCATSNKQLQC